MYLLHTNKDDKRRWFVHVGTGETKARNADAVQSVTQLVRRKK